MPLGSDVRLSLPVPEEHPTMQCKLQLAGGIGLVRRAIVTVVNCYSNFIDPFVTSPVHLAIIWQIAQKHQQ